MKAINFLGVIFIATLTASCSLITWPNSKPVIETKLNPGFFSWGQAGTMAITPERRIAIVNFNTKRFCAEGPTEVVRDSNNIGSIGASFKDVKAFDAGMAAIMANSSVYNMLNPRAQGVQYLMAASFANCQLYMNDGVTSGQLSALQLDVLQRSAYLIEKELPYIALRGNTKKELDDLAAALVELAKLKSQLDNIEQPK